MAAEKPDQRRKHGGAPRNSPLELQISHDDHQDMTTLQPPSFPACPPSPARSQASTARSVSRAMNDMAIIDRPPGKRLKRGGRRGPLPKEKKRRAALVRRVGACKECRRRKVKVSRPDVNSMKLCLVC